MTDAIDKRPRGRRPLSEKLDEDLERERLEPGLNTTGKGDAGADPARAHGDGNSNT